MPDSPPSNPFDSWTLGGIGVIIATLASVVAMFFKLREGENARLLKEMKEDHTASTKEFKDKIALLEEASNKCVADRSELAIKCEVNVAKCAMLEDQLRHLMKRIEVIDAQGTTYGHRKEDPRFERRPDASL